MSSFLKIASGMLLPLSLALVGAGCVAPSADDDTDDPSVIAESALLDQSSTTPPADDNNQTNCGPGTLLQQLPYTVVPSYYGGYPGYYGGYAGAPYYGGYAGAPYYGGYPGYYGGYGGYSGGYYPPGYIPPAGSNSGCGCP